MSTLVFCQGSRPTLYQDCTYGAYSWFLVALLASCSTLLSHFRLHHRQLPFALCHLRSCLCVLICLGSTFLFGSFIPFLFFPDFLLSQPAWVVPCGPDLPSNIFFVSSSCFFQPSTCNDAQVKPCFLSCKRFGKIDYMSLTQANTSYAHNTGA